MGVTREQVERAWEQSEVVRIIEANLKKTTRYGGPVSVVIRGQSLSVYLAKREGQWGHFEPTESDECHRFSGSIHTSGKFWKVRQTLGVAAVIGANRVSDKEAVELVKNIFELVG